MEKISLPVRILAVVLILVGAAGMMMMRTMGPSAEPVAAPVAVKTPAKRPAVTKPAKANAAKPAVTPKRTPAKATPKAVVNPVIRKSGFPLVVDTALQQHEVVVLSLVVPGARVDAIAAAEA